MKVFKRTIGLLASLSLAVACSRNPETSSQVTNEPKIDGPNTEFTKTNCVRVLYDRTSDPRYALGKAYAIYVLNLLGHFPEFQRHLSAVEDYQSGELNKCGVNIYLGTTFDNNLPQAFIDDFKTSDSQLAWLGYNSWKLGDQFLKDSFAVEKNASEPFTVLDNTNLVDSAPSFYKDVLYKGKVFPKYGAYGKTPATASTFYAAYEVVHYDYNAAWLVDSTDHNVLAEVRHNFTNQRLPWAIQSKNRFLISEVPLSYVHTGDRYLVFADLLFDILKAPARHNQKPAVIRLEDVHSKTSVVALERARQILKQNNVKPHMALIPIYLDPLDSENIGANRPELPITDQAALMTELQNYKNDQTEFIWHGITHQLGNLANPWQGTTAADYEFWDYTDDVANNVPTPVYGRPVQGETIQTLLNLFQRGANVFTAAGIEPRVWLTPHYQASSLANYFFGQNFEWSIGRMVYHMNTMTGLDLGAKKSDIKFPKVDPASWSAREAYLRNLVVDQQQDDVYDNDGNPTGQKVYRSFGQMFPYEIYGDVYGQRIFPENLGNVVQSTGGQNIETRSVQQILDDADRNSVLRDTWASAFYHPYLLQAPAWTASNDLNHNDLNDLIVGLKNLGYNFVSLKDFPEDLLLQAQNSGLSNYKDKAQGVVYH